MQYYIFSLGNPGSQYERTRHNAGRITADAINYIFLENNLHIKLSKNDITLKYFVPDTYMNMSGEFIKRKIKNAREDARIIIIYDDIDIPMGEIKISFARSSGGHNGVQSVIDSLGHADFYRIRVGIGAKSNPHMLLQDYVMSKITDDEMMMLTLNVRDKVEMAIEEIVGK